MDLTVNIERFPFPAVTADNENYVLECNEASINEGIVSIRPGESLKLEVNDPDFLQALNKTLESGNSSSIFGFSFSRINLPPKKFNAEIIPLKNYKKNTLLILFPGLPMETNEAGSLQGMLPLIHDIQNSLTGILTASALLERNNHGNASMTQTSKIITNEARRIKSMLDSIRAIETADTPALQPVNLHKIICDAIGFFDNSHNNIAFKLFFDPSLPEIVSNEVMIYRVLINLFKNALEAAEEEKAVIHIKTFYPQSWHRNTSPYLHLGKYIGIDVMDYGKGFQQDDFRDPFAMGSSTKGNKRGYGLYSCKSILNQLNGNIELIQHNSPCIFRIWLNLEYNPSVTNVVSSTGSNT